MPEGDTIHKLAAALRPVCEGRELSRLWLRDRGEIPDLRGRRVEEVAALGKHLLISLAPGASGRRVLHAHLGMYGRVRARPRQQRGSGDAALRLELGSTAWEFRRTARAELLRGVDLAQHPVLSRLGPDLLDDGLDLAAVVRRARRIEARSLSEALLDQRVACGIGNVYRCEVLFEAGLSPWQPLERTSDAVLRGLYACARERMLQNLGPWRRTTVRPVDAARPLRRGEPRTWVHGRAGLPCLRCRAPVRAARLGDAARASFWCPRCQPREPLRPPPEA